MSNSIITLPSGKTVSIREEYYDPNVSVVAPDGTPGTVPRDQVSAAIAAGGKLGVQIDAPDGTPGTIPMDQAHAAIKAGARLHTALPAGAPSSAKVQEQDPYASNPFIHAIPA